MTGMVMPGGMSGADFTERVRQDHPTIKPILTSGYALEQMTDRQHLLVAQTVHIGRVFTDTSERSRRGIALPDRHTATSPPLV
jgi:CheY-like chemotaxis protein